MMQIPITKRLARLAAWEHAPKRLIAIALLICCALINPAAPIVAAQELDELSRKASQLEAELGKYNDNTPEAADVMVKLVDLYHSDARVFGLVRIGNRFVSAHTTDKRHHDVMLKTIDGLQGMSRNKDMLVACRQFVTRYPKSPKCSEVEQRLAEVLDRGTDKKAAAAAFHAIWKRQPNTDVGRTAAITAIKRYSSAGNDQIKIGAELAEKMMDQTSGSMSAELGMHSVMSWARINKWAESNRAASKLLKKNVVKDKQRLRNVHYRVGDNYERLGQHTNAARSYASARKIRDDQQVHYRLIDQLDRGKASSKDISVVAKEYATKYAQRDDRFRGLSALAQAYIREENPGAAISLLGKVLAFDARGSDNARIFVEQNGTDPERMKESERVLLDAISKNEKHAAYLRYTLAFNLYRDRMKDDDKTRSALRELIEKSPDDGHVSRSAVDWLLNSAPDDKAFADEVKRILAARDKHPELGAFAGTLTAWRQSAKRDPKRKQRAKLLDGLMGRADKDPIIALTAKNSFHPSKQEAVIRDKLLADNIASKFSAAYVDRLLDSQGHYYRHYVSHNQRKLSATYYGKLARRNPKDMTPAKRFLEAATDYASPEVAKEAAEHMLRLPPKDGDADVWRRLIAAAEKNKDKAFAQKSLDWILKSQAANGKQPTHASYIGESLDKLGLTNEGIDYWKTYITFDRQNTESRECAYRVMKRLDESKHVAFLTELLKDDTPFQGRYATYLADIHLKAGDIDSFAKVMKQSRDVSLQHPMLSWDVDIWRIAAWVSDYRRNMEVSDDDKRKVYQAIADLQYGAPSSSAKLALEELNDASAKPKSSMARVLRLQNATLLRDSDWNGWDSLYPFAQSAMTRQDYVAAATLSSGMLSNIRADERRQKAAREIVTQAYARMGSVGLTIDEDSPIAPLLQAALYLRLGDESLALATYDANKALFDANRNELPVDLISFVCSQRIAAGGDKNHEYVEDVLRGWMVKNSESAQVDSDSKAKMQLLLAKNYFKARRFDVARSEFTTTINRYPDTIQATEARFGIGESFMSQKVYDQAELVFEELARNPEMEIVVRAEFLRGVLAFRRGDRDDARDIFRSVLERVPDVSLANQALFSLSEVYGSEERYIDQLNLLRTVGRLGRKSTRLHRPGLPLSIVVHDSDLGISRGHNKIPVIVTTKPSGDSERVMLTSTGAGRGLFRTDVDTRLGDAQPGDGILQVVGGDTIECDYPDQFKSEFKKVPLSDVEITIAANAKFEASSSKVVDKKEETFSERVAREAREEAEGVDQRVSQVRPENQIKPGNPVYFRTIDPDRDLSNERDKLPVKLVADSGDSVQTFLVETEPHSGVFEGTAKTAELPAGALASDTAIDHSPLMAIDLDKDSFWLAEPDGATPKTLTVDMKDLKEVSRVTVSTPDPTANAPLHTQLLGSNDGEFWFNLASYPEIPTAKPVSETFGQMTRRVYSGKASALTTWQQIVDLGLNRNPDETEKADELFWQTPTDESDVQRRGKKSSKDRAKDSRGIIWSGKLVQQRSGSARILVKGHMTALAIDGRLQLAPKRGQQQVDLFLERGTHELTIYASVVSSSQVAEALIARADMNSDRVSLAPFTAADFDLEKAPQPKAPVANPTAPIELAVADAKLKKQTEQFGSRLNDKTPLINYWADAKDTASWDIEVPVAGAYEIWLNCSHAGTGSRMAIEIGDDSFAANIPDTRNWNSFRDSRVATVLISKPGKQTMTFRPTEINAGGLMDLRGVSIRPATGGSVIRSEAKWDFRFPSTKLRYTRLVFNEYLGESVAVNHVEIGADSLDETHIPTKKDVLALANNDTLEIAAGDTVTATYTDEFTQNGTGSSQLLTSKLTATYNNARVQPIIYEFTRSDSGQVTETRLELKRIDPNERIVVEIRDYDEDDTNEQDEIEFEVYVNDGPKTTLTAIETEPYSGIFTKEIDTSATGDGDKLVVKPGDKVYLRYLDKQNTFPGHAVERETVVYVTEPTDALIRVLQTRTKYRANDDLRAPEVLASIPADGQEALVSLDAPLTIEVIDPDRAKTSGSTLKIAVITSDGCAAIVECDISSAFTDRRGRRSRQDVRDNIALEQGRFVGQVVLQLGGKNSPQVVPKMGHMPRNLIGTVHSADKDDDEPLDNAMVARVLNVTGKDTITAAYLDKRRTDGEAKKLSSAGRLVTDGALVISDREYREPIESLHVGEKLFLVCSDPDQDVTDERDAITLEIKTELGEHETVQLHETLAHSGLFTGSFQLTAAVTPTPNNFDEKDPAIECYFGDKITATYSDPAAASQSETLEISQEVPVVVGTDGLLTAFTKTFNDETLAVETKFRVAESYFELFKSHKQLERSTEQNNDLESGRRVLREVMEDYPDPKYAPRVAYLLGQFAQELGQWDEAIKSYELIIRRYPDHTLAADARYKLAQSYEEAGDFDAALEAYVTLAATHPKSPLIASVMIRISDYFYKREDFDIAAQVGVRFGVRFEGHEHAAEMAFRVGQCFYKTEDYKKAGLSFDDFVKTFPDDELGPDSLFWSGEAYRLAKNNREAFRRYNRCRWDYPESEAAKYARGRLALPEMLNQFEAEARSVDDE